MMIRITRVITFVYLVLISQMVYAQSKEIIYVGTYAERGSKGIYVMEFDRVSGNSSIIQTIKSKESPNFLAIGPQGRFLFSANSQGLEQMPDWGSVSSYAINPETGTLTAINDQPSYGKGACHVSVYPGGKWIFVSNYGDGIFSILPITHDGKIGASSQRIQLKGSSIDPNRQTGPHTHSVIPSADGSYIYVSDLGIDKVLIYDFDIIRGMVSPAEQPSVDVSKGAGPRHFILHQNGELAFLAEEISSTLNVFKVNPNNGSLRSIFRRSTLPDNFLEYSKVADIHLNPAGNNVYVSNRGHNSIAIFDVIAETAIVKYKKTVSSGGDWPRNFMIDPAGQFMMVANQKSDNVVLFNMTDQGDLVQTETSINIPSPVCIAMLQLK